MKNTTGGIIYYVGTYVASHSYEEWYRIVSGERGGHVARLG